MRSCVLGRGERSSRGVGANDRQGSRQPHGKKWPWCAPCPPSNAPSVESHGRCSVARPSHFSLFLLQKGAPRRRNWTNAADEPPQKHDQHPKHDDGNPKRRRARGGKRPATIVAASHFQASPRWADHRPVFKRALAERPRHRQVRPPPSSPACAQMPRLARADPLTAPPFSLSVG